MDPVRLAKYEAHGNDFLVSFATEAEIDADLASALCDRHRGIGADGLMRLSVGADSISMVLINADGSPAETSGNGLRCAALAASDAGLVAGGVVRIDTVVGPRRAEILGGVVGSAEIQVEMGTMTLAKTTSPLAGKEAFRADVGNPHLVLLGDRIDDVDLGAVGVELERAVPGGQNVEVARAVSFDELEIATFERGAGLTEACGSGSCAAAGAARLAGVVGDIVTVRNPGGTLLVELSGDDPTRAEVLLTGPARRIATFEIHLGDFARGGGIDR